MNAGKQTYYDVLGVPRKASVQEIGRAYRRIRSELQKETAPPDPRRAALAQTAYEVLSDEYRRAEYDDALLGPKVLGMAAAPRSHGRWLWMLASVAAAGAAYWAAQDKSVETPRRSVQEITTAANLAVGRVNRLEISGQTAPLGIAFTLEEGEMVTPCHGLVPGVQLVVKFGPRAAPARMVGADEEGVFCRLLMEGSGSWPLPPGGTAPVRGDTVYAVSLNGAGDPVLTEAKVGRVSTGPRGEWLFDISGPIPADASGGPLLDTHGRVIAAAYAASPGEPLRHRSLSRSWRDAAIIGQAPAKVPAPTGEGQSAATPGKTVPPPEWRNPADITPERRERLEKAFRPPPNVPDDL